MKRKLLFLLAALMPMVASAYDAEIDGIYYNFSGDEATVTRNINNRYSGSVIIPASVTNGGITYSVTSIGEGAFFDCSSLTSITIPNSVTSIDYEAFYDCTGLTSITIPNSVTSMGDEIFSYCSGLTSVTIGNSVTNIGFSAFWDCTGLTSVSFGSSVTSIGHYAFRGCSGLTSITIPESVTTIGDYAFSGCKGLKIFSFGTQVQAIEQEAFSGCTAMETITSKAEIPPVCGSQALDDINKWECTLLVPDGSLTLYQAADQWKEFFFMEIDPDGIKEIENGKLKVESSDEEWYDLSGRKIVNSKLSNGTPLAPEHLLERKNLPRGINIIRYADGTTRKVLVK